MLSMINKPTFVIDQLPVSSVDPLHLFLARARNVFAAFISRIKWQKWREIVWTPNTNISLHNSNKIFIKCNIPIWWYLLGQWVVLSFVVLQVQVYFAVPSNPNVCQILLEQKQEPAHNFSKHRRRSSCCFILSICAVKLVTVVSWIHSTHLEYTSQ